MAHLAADIHVARIRDKAVVLDLKRDRYTALGPRISAGLFALIQGFGPQAGGSSGGDLVAIERALVEQGVLADGDGDGVVERREKKKIISPQASLWPSVDVELGDQQHASWRATLAVMAALAEVALWLHFSPFRSVVARIAREPVRRPHGEASKSEQAALDDYVLARPWFPLAPICRLDALALCLHLRRSGHPADLVFGVRLERFAAHCWVQCGGLVIKEPFEIVEGYSPIMVV